VERPPYELVEGGVLRVREDLVLSLTTAPARSSRDAAELEGFGHVGFAPGASYAVRAPFEGYAEQVHVQVGDHVEAGAVLATLRSSEVARLRAELRRLTATVETERDALARTERLVSENAASAREVVESRGRISALEAELMGIREALSAARTGASGADVIQVRATRAGDVLARHIQPGERVLQLGDSEPAFLIGNSTALVVAASFPERDASLLAQGARCTFTIPSIGSARYEGHVTTVVRAIDPQTRTARVVCAPTTSDTRLRSEMVARVSVSVQGDGALVVPRAAVLLRRDERVVIVRRGARELERRVVTTGLNLGRDIQILSGLSAGEDVVTEGAVLLDGELDQLL
jgi:cobalt-zinc-cadmium efflux system membrane fusion protein